jgi:hypothetical protein
MWYSIIINIKKKVCAMSDEKNTDNKSENEPSKPPAQPPILPPDNDAVLSEAEENPSNKTINVTVNLPLETRQIEWLQLGVSSFLAVVGVVAICIYGGQLDVMKGQLKQMVSGGTQVDKLVGFAGQQVQVVRDMTKAANNFSDSAAGVENNTKEAAKAIQKSAYAAKQSADIATKMFESQRPSIAIENTEIRHIANGRVMEYFITMKNFSNVTAYKTLIRSCGVVFPSYKTETIHLPDRPKIMPPQQEMTFKGFLSGDPKDAVMAGKSTFDMFMYAEYEGPDKKHYTYCEQTHFLPSANELMNLGECDATQEAFAKGTSCTQ